MKEIVIEQLTESIRVDKYLASRFPVLSRSLISSYCKKNLVSLKSGEKLAAGDVLNGGEELCIGFELSPIQASGQKVTEHLAIKIVYQDDYLIVLDKPTKMPSVTLTNEDPVTVADNLLKFDPSLIDVSPDKRESGLIHRLDTPSSGLMIAGRTNLVWQMLREQLKGGEIKKSYSCLIEGKSLYSNYSLLLYLGAKGKKVQVKETEFVESAETNSKISTKWSGIFQGKELSIVSVEASFAKRHQVRAHLAYLDHPLVGDRLYGARTNLKEIFKDSDQEFILHANRLKFIHPIEQKEMQFESDNQLLAELVNKGQK